MLLPSVLWISYDDKHETHLCFDKMSQLPHIAGPIVCSQYCQTRPPFATLSQLAATGAGVHACMTMRFTSARSAQQADSLPGLTQERSLDQHQSAPATVLRASASAATVAATP